MAIFETTQEQLDIVSIRHNLSEIENTHSVDDLEEIMKYDSLIPLYKDDELYNKEYRKLYICQS